MNKLNIGKFLNSTRSGYINITERPIPAEWVQSNEKVVIGNIKILDDLVDDNTVDEIVYNDPLNSLTPDEIVVCFKKYSSKMKKSAKLSINFIDSRRVGLGLHNNSLPLPEAHRLLLGEEGFSFKSVIDTQTVMSVIKEIGLKVEAIDFSGYVTNFKLSK